MRRNVPRERILAFLRALPDGELACPRQMAEALGYARLNVRRLLAQLVAEGLVERTELDDEPKHLRDWFSAAEAT